MLFLAFLSFSPIASAKVVYVTKASVNLRNEPKRESKVNAILVQNDKLEVIGENRYWYHVNTQKDDTGWVSKSLVNEGLPLIEKFELKKKENQALNEEIRDLKKKVNEEIGRKKEMAGKVRNKKNEIRKIMEENNRLNIEKEYLSSAKNVIFALIGISIFIIGWLFGFLTGFYKKQSDNKNMENLMSKMKSKFIR